jgi:hypothetical protein
MVQHEVHTKYYDIHHCGDMAHNGHTPCVHLHSVNKENRLNIFN